LAAIAAGGSRVALADDESQWTFDDLAAAIEYVADSLDQVKVTSDDAVLIIAPLRNAAAAAYLGTVNRGAVAVLLDRRCGEADIAGAVLSANPRVAFAFDDDARRLGLARHCDVLPLDRIDIRHRPTQSPGVMDLDPDVPAAVVFTSGTTSAPKGVVHTINSLRCGAANMIKALNIGADDALFLSTPWPVSPACFQLEPALTMHAKLILEEKFSAQRSLQRIYDHGATAIGGAPFITETILDEALRLNQPIPLRCIALGGSMVPESVLEKAARFGVAAVRVYGSSEAPFSTATSSADGTTVSDDGSPMPGVEVGLRATDDELIIRGPHQFHGYLEAAQNEGAFSDDWVRTGDIAEVAYQRIRIKGRLKEVVIRKGIRSRCPRSTVRQHVSVTVPHSRG
jgi:acyl-CoA synthetase (AMP-forming)/AMP-acid ligase II